MSPGYLHPHTDIRIQHNQPLCSYLSELSPASQNTCSTRPCEVSTHTHTTTCCAPPLFMKMYLRSSTSNPIHLEHSAFHHTPILPSIKWMASTQTFLWHEACWSLLWLLKYEKGHSYWIRQIWLCWALGLLVLKGNFFFIPPFHQACHLEIPLSTTKDATACQNGWNPRGSLLSNAFMWTVNV